jgi:hypothetical protein
MNKQFRQRSHERRLIIHDWQNTFLDNIDYYRLLTIHFCLFLQSCRLMITGGPGRERSHPCVFGIMLTIENVVVSKGINRMTSAPNLLHHTPPPPHTHLLL